jgi:dipeptidyl aminopeptidase/acylaminoacyl peptidase
MIADLMCPVVMGARWPDHCACSMTPTMGAFVTKRALLLLISLLSLNVASFAGDEFGPDSLLNWQFVGDPQISPDGRHIVYVRVSVDRDRDDYNRELWLASDDGTPRPLTSGSNDFAPRWSPDGRRLAFISGRSEKRQIFILELAGGEAWQLTSDKDGVGAFAWSPDAKRIAFTSRTALAGDPGFEEEKTGSKDKPPARVPFVTEDLIYRNDGTPGYRNGKRAQIWIVPTSAGPKPEAQRITHTTFNVGEPAWAIDGRSILFSGNGRQDADYASDDTEIFVVATDGNSAPRALTDRRGPDADPLPSPDGKWIAFTGFDEATPPRSSSVTNLYVMRPDGSAVRELASDLDRNIGETTLNDSTAPGVNGKRIAWSADSRNLLLVAADRGQARLFNVEAASGKFTEISQLKQGEVRDFSLSRNGIVVAAFSSSAQPTEIYQFPLKAVTKPWKRVSSHTAALAPLSGFSEYQDFTYNSFDGRPIQAWIIKPAGFDPERKYPMILYIHGGPHAMYGSSFFHEFQVLAHSGFVLLITNPRGSTGYGGEFANIIQYRYPGDDYRDLMAGVDQMLARGYVDEKRLGVAGGSGGGLLTSWTVGQTGRFQAAVVDRAVTNWFSFVGTSDLNYYFVTHWFRDFPWRDNTDYLERSPLSHVDQVTTPVLVIHSEQDYRTALDQGLQFYTALKMLKKPAKLAVFPDSSHGMSREGRPSLRVARLALIRDWFLGKLTTTRDREPQEEQSAKANVE